MPTTGFSHTAVSYSRGAGGAHYTDLLPSPPAQNKNSLDASALLQREPLRIQNHAPNSSPSSSAILAELVRCTTRSVESRCCACLFRSAHTAAWLGEMCRAFLPLRPATYNPISPEREEKRVRYKSHLYTLKDNMLP